MSYIGSTPTTQSFISGTDYFNGTGSQTAFTLSRTVASVNDVEAVVNNVVQRPNDAYTISGTTITFTSAPSAGTSNIYVRYLSTTTQSITPSQNTVSYATWDSDLRNETWAFRNRVINGDMAIDQRNNGAAVTINDTSAYTVDRWFGEDVTDGAFTVQRISDAPVGFNFSSRITITTADASLAAGQYAAFYQRFEGFNTADFMWGTANAVTVTLSFWVKSSLTGTFGGVVQNGAENYSYPFTYTISAANTWEYKTVTIVGPTAGTWQGATNNRSVILGFSLGSGSTFTGPAGAWAAADDRGGANGQTNIIGTLGATWQVTGVQLEKGFTATNFDVLPFGTELALCQRYYFRVNPAAGSHYGSGLNNNNSDGFFTVPFPVTMRTSPTSLEQTGTASNYSIFRAGDIPTCTSVPTFESATVQVAMVKFTSANNITSGQACIGRSANSAGFLAWSAEL